MALNERVSTPSSLVGGVEIRLPENLIPDSTQEDGKQQTGSNAKGGGGDSHSARSLWPLYWHITACESTCLAINH